MSSYDWDWTEFDPKVGQTDKRDREGILSKGVKLVKKNFNELGLSTFVSVPVVDRNRTIQNIVHISPSNSPREDYIKDKENKKSLE